MEGAGTGREIRNIMEYSSGLIVCLDQNSERIEEYFGPKDQILPRLKDADLSKARIRRMVRKGKGFNMSWESISSGKLLASCR